MEAWHATISIPSIPASNTVTRSFQFTVPNSEKVPGAVITYDNQTQISANGSDFAVITNDLYIDAPVDYKSAGTSPAVIKLHGTTLLATPAHVPNVGESFPVNYSLSFTGLPAWVTTVGLPLLDTPFFDHAAPGGTVSVSIGAQGTGSSLSNTTKASPRGYLLLGWLVPDMALGSLVRYVPPAHVQIGQVALKIDKYVLQGATLISNAMTITRDELVSVQVKVTNTGTLPLGLVEEEDASNPLGFFVSDNFGYPQAAFVVVSGNVSAAALVLEPGNSTSFTYTVTATKVGVHELGAVEKEYLFITRRSTSSNSITVTVNEKPVLVLVYVGTSVGVLVAVVAFSAYDRKKQRRAWEEFKRTDKVLYEEIEKDEKRSYSEYLD